MKVLAKFLCLIMVLSITLVTQISVSAASLIAVPNDWQILGIEDFNGVTENTSLTSYSTLCSPSLITGLWTDTTSTYLTGENRPTVRS